MAEAYLAVVDGVAVDIKPLDDSSLEDITTDLDCWFLANAGAELIITSLETGEAWLGKQLPNDTSFMLYG